MEIYNAVIELTRRCNMTCWHCLRGDAENLDMDMKYVDEFFSKVDSISDLTLTGGEPSLVPEIIGLVLDSIEKHNVEIGRFYLVTNAKDISEEFLKVLLRMYMMTSHADYNAEYSMPMVQYSNDMYHDNITDKNSIRLLKAYSFVGARNKEDNAEYNCVDQGNASYNIADCRPLNLETFYAHDDIVVEGTVYLNCEGWIIAGCDWSYENQDDDDHECRVCPVSEFDINKIKNYKMQLV